MSDLPTPSKPTRLRIGWPQLMASIRKSGATLLVALIALGGYYGSHYWLPGSGHETEDAEQDVGNMDLPTIVLLNEEKRLASGIEARPIGTRTIQPVQMVPGSITYNALTKVDLRASIDSIVIEVLVQPGQHVVAGQPLLVLSGPELGEARAAVKAAESNLAMAQAEYDWAAETNLNLLDLLALMKQEPTVDQINEAFEGKNLGEHRNEVLSAYSRWQLAQKMWTRSTGTDSRETVPGKILDERKSEMEVAWANCQGLAEQSRFQTQQDLKISASNLERARRELALSHERLATLLGPFADHEFGNDAASNTSPESKAPGSTAPAPERLSTYRLLAPRTGVVVDLTAAPSARFQPGEVIVSIAETERLWVQAQVSQEELGRLKWEPQDTVEVTLPGRPQQHWAARVQFLGSALSAQTLSVPLVAELDNGEGVFRPGMMAWVRIPQGPTRDSLVVPESAIQRDGSDVFVFVREDENRFARANVTTGIESDGWVEILTGLQADAIVVDQGAFYLKSELLLEPEE